MPNIPPSISSRFESVIERFRDLDVDSLRLYLAHKLGICEPQEPSAPVEKVLNEVTLDGIVNWIKSDRCKNIITLSGAGISTGNIFRTY